MLLMLACVFAMTGADALAQHPRQRGRDRQPAEAQEQAQEAEEPASPEDATPEEAEALPETPLADEPAPYGQTLGFGADTPLRAPVRVALPQVAVPDRWRLGWQPWDRYGRRWGYDDVFLNAVGGDVPFTEGHPLNPYDRNALKGDYPVIGDDIFMNVVAISDTFGLARELPTPSGVSADDAGAFDFFGDGRQNFFAQTFILNVDLFKGYTSFRPVDWLVNRMRPAAHAFLLAG